jgi:hypothetical protein
MTDASRRLAGILFVLVPTVEFGGWSLLRMIARRIPGYLDNPVRQNLFPAGRRPPQPPDRPRLPGCPLAGGQRRHPGPEPPLNASAHNRGPGHGRVRMARNMAVSSVSDGGSTRWNQ